MKKTVKKVLEKSVENTIIWNMVNPIVKGAICLKNARKSYDRSNSRINSTLQNPFDSLTVINGPFKGMVYPDFDSSGSALIPKLLGSYESELQASLFQLCKNRYDVIINIGCGEGYYAVGLALLKPNATVFAYDISPKARMSCKKMADLNGVGKRVTVKENFYLKDLQKIDNESEVLIICDCEGHEKNIFLKDNLDAYANCDLIIETHDFLDIEISTYLKKLFNITHSVNSIYSIDDIQKVFTYNYKELENLTLQEKKNYLTEKRPSIMEWIVCEKSNGF